MNNLTNCSIYRVNDSRVEHAQSTVLVNPVGHGNVQSGRFEIFVETRHVARKLVQLIRWEEVFVRGQLSDGRLEVHVVC